MKELLHFTATWCNPCKQMAPMIDKFIADNPQINYTKIDADTNPEIFQEYGITGIPAFIVKTDGNQTNSHTGIATAEKFAELFDK